MFTTPAAVAIILVGIVFVVKRVDVRLVLGVCAYLLFALQGRLTDFFLTVAAQMTNDKTVVPICSAMGFAYVLKHTGCDQHLVRMLVAPLRYVKILLVPGGVASAYVVNMAVVSQSSVAACVGPVLIPLLTAARVPALVAGSTLLLGASMGGELFNPGAVEIVTLAELTGLGAADVVATIIPRNLIACVTALLIFWWLSARTLHRTTDDEEVAAVEPSVEVPRVNAMKALVPLLPLVLLFSFALDTEHRLPELSDSIRILVAMLVGVVAAALTSPRRIPSIARPFFEGAGFAYANVISLIIVATAFTEGVKANGLIEMLTSALAGRPYIALTASVVLPLGLAVTTGSGIAPAVAVMKVLVPVAETMHLDPVRVGALIAVAAQLGRTMSLAAAVVMMSATVSGQPPRDLVKRVAPPLLAGAAVLLVAALVGGA